MTTDSADTPPIVVFMQEAGSLAPDRMESAGRWRAERAWPPAGATERSLELGPGGRLAEDAARAGAVEAADLGPDRLVVDPSVGVEAGGLWSGGVPFGLSVDQRPDEALSLTYTSAPLDAPLSILGRARADLHVAASVAVLGVAVSLADVAPDGASHLVAKGMLNGTRRSSLTDPEPLVPGEVVPLSIDIDATGWRFVEGHRIRVSIAGGDFPNVWPTPSPATLELHRSPDAPSRLVLPVVPDDGPIPPPAFAPSPILARHASAIDPPARWTVTRDALTGRVASEIQFQSVHSDAGGHAHRTRRPEHVRGRSRAIPRTPSSAPSIGVRAAATGTRSKAGPRRSCPGIPPPSTSPSTSSCASTTSHRFVADGSNGSRANSSDPDTRRTRWPIPVRVSSPMDHWSSSMRRRSSPTRRWVAVPRQVWRRVESTGRLLLTFSHVVGAELGNQAALMVTRSDDEGTTWSEPVAVYAQPGWFCLAMGGFARIADDDIKLMLGRIQIDLSIGGTEPMTGWYVASTTTRDGGETWSDLSPEIRLFPEWTELYGASNPHRLSDGRLLWAVMGTRGRDIGWHAGRERQRPCRRPHRTADDHRRRPRTATTATSTSSGWMTDGSWRSSASIRPARACSPIRATRGGRGPGSGRHRSSGRISSSSGFARARSRARIATRTRRLRGVSLSVSEDGGETWTFAGQLYAADPDALHEPGSVCGYPDVAVLGSGDLAVVLHAYPTAVDGTQLHWLRLRDRT